MILSKTQIKKADCVGGIRLIIPFDWIGIKSKENLTNEEFDYDLTEEDEEKFRFWLHDNPSLLAKKTNSLPIPNAIIACRVGKFLYSKNKNKEKKPYLFAILIGVKHTKAKNSPEAIYCFGNKTQGDISLYE